MIRMALVGVVAGAAIGCGSDGVDNELGQATVDGVVSGVSFSNPVIAWRGRSDTGSSIISIQETGSACSRDFGAGATLRLVFNCDLAPGSFTVDALGSRDCPDEIVAGLSTDGNQAVLASGGTVDLEMAESSLVGTFDIEFEGGALSGSFNLRDCGDV